MRAGSYWVIVAALAISACGGLEQDRSETDTSAKAAAAALPSLTLQPGFPVGAEARGTGTVTSPTYAVAATDLVLAFVGSDAGAGSATFSLANPTSTGGTLSWTRIGAIANTANGAVAVYRGTPSAALSSVRTQVAASGGSQAYISVVAIAGASSTLGAVATASGSGTAAAVTVGATAAGSWVFAVGEDWNGTTRRTLSGTVAPTLVDERSDPALNDYWVERAQTSAAGSFRIGTSAPTTANWNMIAVEVVPAVAPAPPPPAPSPAGLAVRTGFPVGAETNGSSRATTPAYAVAASDVVLAFVGTDAPSGAAGFSLANATASGGTLSWTRIASANTSNGAVAVFRGTPSAALTGVTTTLTTTGGPQAYVSVVAVTGASGTLGAVTTAGGGGTAAAVTLSATSAGSWIFAVGEDWDATTARTLSGTIAPTLVDERSDPALNDYWVERAVPAAAGSFRIGTSAPGTADWNMVAVEVLPAGSTPPAPPPPPPPTPAPAAATPSIAPGTSTSSAPVTATITCPTSGTLPYRTTDGTTPTTASTQSGTATFAASGTLAAICAGGGYGASAVATATYTIVPTPSPAPGAAMTTAHRTAGVAPLAVFFDAVDTVASGTAVPYTWRSGVTQPSDLEGSLWEWDFGDASAGTWKYGVPGRSKNQAIGYTAAHVYETPGVYTATLKVTDTGGTVRTYSQTITVSAFSGTTYYVSATGSDSSSGTSPSTPFLTINKAMTTALGTSGSVRVLFRRGDTFNASTSYNIAKSDPGCALGAYADGTAGHTASDARPIINVPELGDANVFSIHSPANDWRVMDLEGHVTSTVTNTSTGFVGGPVEPQIVNLLLLRVRITGNSGVGIGWWVWNTTAGSGTHDGMVVAECEVISSYNCAYYVGGRRFAILGSSGIDGRATHIARVWGAHKGVIANNSFLRPGGQRHALKLHGMEWQVSTTYPDTAYVSVADNVFQGSGTSQWTVSVGSQSSLYPDETGPVRNVVIERNRFSGSATTLADIESEAEHLMVRNNVMDDTASGEIYSFIYSQRNQGSFPATDARFYNNTIYKGSATPQGVLIQTDSSASSVKVRNNLWGVSSATNLALSSGAPSGGWTGAGNALDHDLLTASPGFTNAAGGDLSLAAGSPAANAGATLGEVREDFNGTARPVGSAYDLGAYESR